MPWMIEVPPLYQVTTPDTIDAEPSVVISALTPNRVTTRPLTSPPSATPKRMPSHIGKCQFAYEAALNTEDINATEPTDRSNCPQTSGTIEPSAMTARIVWLDRMLR